MVDSSTQSAATDELEVLDRVMRQSAAEAALRAEEEINYACMMSQAIFETLRNEEGKVWPGVSADVNTCTTCSTLKAQLESVLLVVMTQALNYAEELKNHGASTMWAEQGGSRLEGMAATSLNVLNEATSAAEIMQIPTEKANIVSGTLEDQLSSFAAARRDCKKIVAAKEEVPEYREVDPDATKLQEEKEPKDEQTSALSPQLIPQISTSKRGACIFSVFLAFIFSIVLASATLFHQVPALRQSSTSTSVRLQGQISAFVEAS